ncbi:superoxide dismutase family protein, partial [Salmonella enterica subsp. enterica serovar Paratyphi A]
MHDDSHEDDHNSHGLDFKALGHVRSDAHHYERDHYVPGVMPGDRRALPEPGTFVDDWEHAYCNMMPNSDIPESQVRGKIDISQRIGGRYGVFFDIDVHGLDLTRSGNIYSIHVHERSVDGQRCDTAGGYNRPSVAALSDPGTFGEEHAGNIGTFKAEADGEIDHEISASIDVTFDEMIGKAIVVHSQDKTRLAC